MADKAMRIAGRDSAGNAKAVKTDTEGNLGINFASSDIAMPMDLQYNNLTDAEALPVRQVRKKNASVFHARAVRNANSTFVYLDVPANAIGAIIKLKIHAVTGMTFVAGQGVRLQTVLCIPGSTASLSELSTQKLQTASPHVCMFFPGYSTGDMTGYSATTPSMVVKGSGVPIAYMRIGVRIQIDGTPDATGGFDCEVEADWLT